MLLGKVKSLQRELADAQEELKWCAHGTYTFLPFHYFPEQKKAALKIFAKSEQGVYSYLDSRALSYGLLNYRAIERHYFIKK